MSEHVARTRKVQTGDVFRIQTPCGPCAFQYVQRQRPFGQLVSVFEEGTWNEPAAIPRQFDIFFPVTWAAKQPDVEFIGRFGLPTEYLAPVPLRYPLRKISTGAVVGWMIIEGESRRKVTELSEAEHHYTYAFAVNIPRLAELFCLKWNAAEPFPD